MKVTAIATHKITEKDKDLYKILDKYLPELSEKSVIAITSKIVAICEGCMVKIGKVDKDDLIRKEATLYIPRSSSKYNVCLTIAGNILAASAGIDESNGNGYYILWPKDPQQSANKIRKYLKRRFRLTSVGVVITDSKTTPLRWGITGFALSHTGFRAINNYIGKRDLFGRRFEYEKVNVMDSVAAAAAIVMGEGSEQTPIALIEDVSFVKFQKRNPTSKELRELMIALADDLYAPLLKAAPWRKGGAFQ